MEEKKDEKITKFKINDVIKILKGNENYLKYIDKNDEDRVIFIKNLQLILRPYKNLDANIILTELENNLIKYKIKKKIKYVLDEKDIENLSYDELKELLITKTLSKNDLLLIADKYIGMPVGNLKTLKKEFIIDRILAMIDNFKKLETIKKKAKE